MSKLRLEFSNIEALSLKLADEWDYDKNTITPDDVSKNCDCRVWWKCLKGHSFLKSVYSRAIKDRGCPICTASGFEKMAYSVLDSYGMLYECEYMPDDLPFKGRYDIYLIDKNSLIELDGEHHFRDVDFGYNYSKVTDVSSRDKIKDEYAYKNGINLLRIPYVFMDTCYMGKFIETFIKDGVVMQEIIDFYSNFSFSEYAHLAEKQNERNFK